MDIRQVLTFMVPYISGMGILYLWQKNKQDSQQFFYWGSWTLLNLSVYLGIIESQESSFFWIIPLTFFGLFFLSYRYEKTHLRNGFLFNIFLIISGIYLAFNYIRTNNSMVLLLIFGALFILLAVTLFGITGLTILLYWNAVIVLRRESRSLTNLLTLITAIGLTFLLIYDHFISNRIPEWLSPIMAILPAGFIYFASVFLNFLTVSILYQFNQPRLKQDFIIILGAGLIDGERVTPLLAQRIDKAIAFYRRQEKYRQPPKLIMSGGQGPDEKIPEGIAMKNYALTQNIPEENILVETNSTTTLENMKFSKEIILQQPISKANVIFSSNNYHIFRAGIFARWAGLKADGIGSKTAFYYLPNAFLREFVAIVAMNKKRHFIIVGLIALGLLLVSLILLIMHKIYG